MRLLALLVAAPALLAQNAFWLDISGQWRYRVIDQPECALPTYDDSGWKPLQLPRGDALAPATLGTVYWIRGSVDTPEAMRGQPLALTLGIPASVYELYVNGHPIPTPTTLDRLDQAAVPQARTYDLPPESTARSPLVIALRARSLSMPPSWRLQDVGPYILSSRAVAPVNQGELQLYRNWVRLSPRLIMGSALGTLGFISLLFWLGFREQTRQLWFSLWMLWQAFNQEFNAMSSVAYPLFDSGGQTWAASLGSGLEPPLHATFVLAALGSRSWLLLSLPWLAFALQVAKIGFRWYGLYWNPDHIGLIAALCMLWALGSRAVQAWRAGRPHAQDAILWAVLSLSPIAMAWNFVQVSALSQSAARYFQVGPFAIGPGQVFALPVPVLILFLLGRRVLADRREKDRLASEMEAGRTIQQLMLAAPPSSGPWQVEAVYRPALEVGGDFHWARVTDDGALLLAVGDVSGKGLKAAMLVSVAIGILRNEKAASPGAILHALNEGLAGHTGGGFVTCCCARFSADGKVTVANAGHPPPYRDGLETAVEAGLPMGIVAGASYNDCTLPAGERFTFVSDGVVEAANAKGELFGFDRTREISMKSAQEIAEAARAWGQNDDITVVTVRRSA